MDTKNILNVMDSILLAGEFLRLSDDGKKAYNKFMKLRNKLNKREKGKGHDYTKLFPE